MKDNRELVRKYCLPILATSYDPDAICPLWDQFLIDASDGDPLLAEFYTLTLGIALRRAEVESDIIICYGGSSKETYISVVKHLLKEYICTISYKTLTKGADHKDTGDGIRSLLQAKLVFLTGLPDVIDEDIVHEILTRKRLLIPIDTQNSNVFDVRLRYWIVTENVPTFNPQAYAIPLEFRRNQSYETIDFTADVKELRGIYRKSVEMYLSLTNNEGGSK